LAPKILVKDGQISFSYYNENDPIGYDDILEEANDESGEAVGDSSCAEPGIGAQPASASKHYYTLAGPFARE